MGCRAAEATSLGFVCFVVLNLRVLLANKVDFGLLFYRYSNFTPPPPQVVFCAVSSGSQVKGYGRLMMNHLKVSHALLVALKVLLIKDYLLRRHRLYQNSPRVYSMIRDPLFSGMGQTKFPAQHSDIRR